ncbi:MAG: iron-containing redox enzyme family protein [Nitrospiria bacterium]
MDKKDHWGWRFFSQEKISKDQLKIHFKQEYQVYVRDFPVFLSRILSKSPPKEVRHDLAENIYEEETGRLSRTGPHPDLFLKMMKGLGFDPFEFQNVEMLPESIKYRNWLDEVTSDGVWYEGAAVIAIFVEGSVKDRQELQSEGQTPHEDIEKAILKHPLVKIHGVNPKDMDLARAHNLVERGHRKAAWKMVLDHVDTVVKQEKVKNLIKNSLDLWLAYRDGVAKACQLRPS